MRLILVDRGLEMCEVFRWQFRKHPEVEIVCGRFEDLPAYDCVHERVHCGGRWGFENPRR